MVMKMAPNMDQNEIRQDLEDQNNKIASYVALRGKFNHLIDPIRHTDQRREKVVRIQNVDLEKIQQT